MSRAKVAGQAGAGSDTYFELVKRHPLASIRKEQDLDAAQAIVDGLLREDLDEGGLTYLDALSDLIMIYEQKHHTMNSFPPHQMLVQILEDRNMSQAELARATGMAKATVSDLATGKRRFTVQHMHTVAKVFGLPGSLFMANS